MLEMTSHFSRWLAALLTTAAVAGCGAYAPPNASVVDKPRTAAEIQERQKIAQAMFAERCKKAGVRIYRTDENVEGIFLMKIRPEHVNYDQQYLLDDPYGRDSTGPRYIMNFLQGYYHQRPWEKQAPGAPARTGFLYVEAVDPVDHLRYRYTGGMRATSKKDVTAPGVQAELKRDPNYDLNVYEFAMDKTPSMGPRPRYGVTYDDISTSEERYYWIAGSSLKVIDLETNEVMAERIGYMMDWAQGSKVGGRSPWIFAADKACPGFQQNPLIPVIRGEPDQPSQTLFFVEKVLKPKVHKGAQ